LKRCWFGVNYLIIDTSPRSAYAIRVLISDLFARKDAMEIQEMPIAEIPESEAILKAEDKKLDRIAFELWRRSSLPDVGQMTEAEPEEVAAHASCL
jgi:hypothetical protein